jgi:hypothetical protein
MTGHPAVEAAAVALLCGWDPWSTPAHAGVERIFADAVLQRAAELRAEEMSRQVEAIGHHVGNRVGEVVAQMFR